MSTDEEVTLAEHYTVRNVSEVDEQLVEFSVVLEYENEAVAVLILDRDFLLALVEVLDALLQM